MKLNNKGYMLIEIILASALAFGIAYFLLKLTYKFKNENDFVYKSIENISVQNLITENIMDDISKGSISILSYDENTHTLDFKITFSSDKVENRRIAISNNNTIIYGKTLHKDGDFITNDISYYKKTLPKDVKIKKVEFNDSDELDFSTYKIIIDSLYDNNTYDIKLLLSKREIEDDQAGNCYKITLNGGSGTSALYYNYSNKNIYNNMSCTGTPATTITKPSRIVTMPTLYFNLDGGNYNGETGTTNIQRRYQTFDSYRYNNKVLIDSSGKITEDEDIILSIKSDITLEPTWGSTYYITLPKPTKSMVTCEGWYSDSERLNKVGNCNQKYYVNDNAEKTYYVKWETAPFTYGVSNIGAKTLQEAIQSINPNGTITMQKDADLPPNTIINGNISLNLNNKTLLFRNLQITIESNATLTITSNGTIKGTGSYLFENKRNGTLIINNGTFINERGVLIRNIGTLTITNGTFKGCEKTILNNGASTEKFGITTISNGIFKTSNSSCPAQALVNNYSERRNRNGYSIQISGGTFWHGGEGASAKAAALKNMDDSFDGYGIFVEGTTMKAYSRKYHVVYAEKGTIQLNGGEYYSLDKRFTKTDSGAKILKGNKYTEKVTKLNEPPG